jgi:thymidylate synthase (FAD)
MDRGTASCDRDRVKLITVTPDAEDLVVYMARVSNPSNQSNNQGSEKLIKYLINHKHWSPFEMVHMVLEINTTRSISSQILRHRSFSFQEFSQRYADTEAIGYAKAPHLRRQDLTNRQNSIDDLDTAKTQIYYRRIGQLFEEAQDLYREMVSSGVAKECAREVLPLATPTRMYMAGSIRSWIHYIDLRSQNGTQLEHLQLANEVKQIFCKELPTIGKALDWL